MVVGRVLQIVAHRRSKCIVKPSVPEKSVVKGRKSLMVGVVQYRYHFNMKEAFNDSSGELRLDDTHLVVHDNCSEEKTDLDEIHHSILFEAVDNITQDLF